MNSSRIVSSRISEQDENEEDLMFPTNQNLRNEREQRPVSTSEVPAVQNRLNVREEQKQFQKSSAGK